MTILYDKRQNTPSTHTHFVYNKRIFHFISGVTYCQVHHPNVCRMMVVLCNNMQRFSKLCFLVTCFLNESISLAAIKSLLLLLAWLAPLHASKAHFMNVLITIHSFGPQKSMLHFFTARWYMFPGFKIWFLDPPKKKWPSGHQVKRTRVVALSSKA